jgi:hypothetical protein
MPVDQACRIVAMLDQMALCVSNCKPSSNLKRSAAATANVPDLWIRRTDGTPKRAGIGHTAVRAFFGTYSIKSSFNFFYSRFQWPSTFYSQGSRRDMLQCTPHGYDHPFHAHVYAWSNLYCPNPSPHSSLILVPIPLPTPSSLAFPPLQ